MHLINCYQVRLGLSKRLLRPSLPHCEYTAGIPACQHDQASSGSGRRWCHNRRTASKGAHTADTSMRQREGPATAGAGAPEAARVVAQHLLPDQRHLLPEVRRQEGARNLRSTPRRAVNSRRQRPHQTCSKSALLSFLFPCCTAQQRRSALAACRANRRDFQAAVSASVLMQVVWN